VKPEQLIDYCLAKPGAWEDEPWEGDIVAKIGPRGKGKIFAFMGQTSIGVKAGADRDEADEWLVRYPDDAEVMAYIGRSGWNTLRIGGAIPDDEIREAIDLSYDLVVAKLPKRDRPSP
jgi:predicted DNA-binding protein (MmcQ/YjbR family)